ncbi:histone deacetylase 8-like isoform X2 [Hyposmocoma kahamanoa]|nr:histone deacetylase 8-like isoform X2 [Hyposmocoma kahamanoa]
MTNAQDEEYGIGYDCPPVSNMFELISSIAGGSITAAKCLVMDIADVAINWCGGWHHAQRFAADGFCYVNDIVIAIETLKIKFSKVLYIDLDVHHGNGVQDAYNLSKSVFTLSFHKYEPGFYPGTGNIADIGTHTGTGYCCNIPLRAAYSDDTLTCMFKNVFTKVYSLFKPDAVVVQCGADALAHDPNGGTCLTIKGYTLCVQSVLDKRIPTILLGGGGYNHPNAARLWTSLTALTIGKTLDEDIPDHSNWPSYGPTYTLSVEPTLMKDTNKQSYLDECIRIINGHLDKYLPNEDIETKRRKTDNITKNPGISNHQRTQASTSKDCMNKDYKRNKEYFCTNGLLQMTTQSKDVYEFTDD